MIQAFAFLGAFVLALTSFAQTVTEDIRMEKSKFYQGNRLLKNKDVLQRLEGNTEAYNEFKIARSNYGASQALGFVGGALIGWPLGTALAGGDPQWGLAAGGAALVLAALPFDGKFRKHARNALSMYNGQPVTRVDVRFRFYGYGAAVVLKM